MNKVSTAISSVVGITTVWYMLTQLHVIPVFYVGRLSITTALAVVIFAMLIACWIYSMRLAGETMLLKHKTKQVSRLLKILGDDKL